MSCLKVHFAASAALMLLLAAGGCTTSETQYQQLTEQLSQSQKGVRQLQSQNLKLQAEVRSRQEQVANLQRLGAKRLDQLFTVEQIALGRYTGGVNLDGGEGDDGIRVFLQPTDAHGSIIKAAGDVTVQLFDLAADPKANLIGQFTWTPQQIADKWLSGFFSYHFRLDCPWPAGPPAHDEITVRVQFVDYLTGKTFSAQKLCKVKLSATTKPSKS